MEEATPIKSPVGTEIMAESLLAFSLLAIAVLGYGVTCQGLLDTVLPLVFSFYRQKHLLHELFPHIGNFSWLFRTLSQLIGGYVSLRLVLSGYRAGMNQPEEDQWRGRGNVMLFACKTTHARTFPKKHAFAYSYLVVGVPVGWEGCASGMVSVGHEPEERSLFSRFTRPRLRKGWYHVDPADYLERGHGRLGLRGKLDRYLRQEVRGCLHDTLEQDGFLFRMNHTNPRRALILRNILTPI